MRVYRLEDLDNVGIFNSGIVAKAWHDKLDGGAGGETDPYRHPNPHVDVPCWSKREDRELFFCGFHSIEQLSRWFDSEALRKAMKMLGGRMLVFEVADEDVLMGHAQIMFKKGSAILLGTLPIPTLV